MKWTFWLNGMLIIASFSMSATAEKYYKWIDRNGVTHYSEARPADTPAALIKVKAGSQVMQTPDTAIPENASDRRLKPSALQPRQPTEHQLAVQRSNCTTARNKLIALENAGRVRQLHKQTGEYRYLPNEEKLAEISKMRQYLKSNCRSR